MDWKVPILSLVVLLLQLSLIILPVTPETIPQSLSQNASVFYANKFNVYTNRPTNFTTSIMNTIMMNNSTSNRQNLLNIFRPASADGQSQGGLFGGGLFGNLASLITGVLGGGRNTSNNNFGTTAGFLQNFNTNRPGLLAGLVNAFTNTGNGLFGGILRPNYNNNGNQNSVILNPPPAVPNNGGGGYHQPQYAQGWTNPGGYNTINQHTDSAKYTNWRNLGMSVGRLLKLTGQGTTAALKTVSATLQGFSDATQDVKGVHPIGNHQQQPLIQNHHIHYNSQQNLNPGGWQNNGISGVVKPPHHQDQFHNNQLPSGNTGGGSNLGWTNNNVVTEVVEEYSLPPSSGYFDPNMNMGQNTQYGNMGGYGMHHYSKHGGNFGMNNSPFDNYQNNEILVVKSPGTLLYPHVK